MPKKLVFALLLALLCHWNGSAYGQSSGGEAPQACLPDSAVLFHFVPGKLMFYSGYHNNEQNINTLAGIIKRNRAAINSGELIVRVNGYCTSFSTVEKNIRAAKNRSNQVKSFYITNYGLREDNFRTYNAAKQWNGRKDIVAVVYLEPKKPAPAEPDVPARATCPVDVTKHGSGRAQVQRPAHSGAADRAGSAKNGVNAGTAGSASAGTQAASRSAEAARMQAEENLQGAPGVKSIQEHMPGENMSGATRIHKAAPMKQPRYTLAVKTNAALWAATVANLGVEFAFGSHYSVDVPVIFSPYTVKRDYRLNVLAIQPEFRYWLAKPMKGHFFGLHVHTGWYNVATDNRERYQDARPLYGAGISYGYNLPIGRKWGVEFTVGGGYINTKYDTFYNVPNGALIETRTRDYWGLTRAGISFMYKFNLK